MDYVVRLYRWLLSWFCKSEELVDVDPEVQELTELEQTTFVTPEQQVAFPLREEMLHRQARLALRNRHKRKRRRSASLRYTTGYPAHVYGMYILPKRRTR